MHQHVIVLLLALCGMSYADRDCSKNRRSALHFATAYGSLHLVRFLLFLNMHNPNAEDEYCWTPLMHAAFYGRENAAKTLLSNKKIPTNPNIQNYIGKTALIIATQQRHENVVRAILNHHGEFPVDPNLADNNGQTALMFAAGNGNTIEILALLDHHGEIPLDLNLVDHEGRTALMFAVMTHNVDAVFALLGHRGDITVDISLADNKKRTALTIARNLGSMVLVNALEDYSAAMAIQTHDTPLEMSEKVKQVYANNEPTPQCQICFGDVALNTAVFPDCGSHAHLHIHHSACLKLWVHACRKKVRDPTCPTCRQPASKILQIPISQEIQDTVNNNN